MYCGTCQHAAARLCISLSVAREYFANITHSSSLSLSLFLSLSLSLLPDTSIFLRRLFAPFLLFGQCTRHKHGALINIPPECIRFFTLPQQKHVALIFASCIPRSRETGVPLPTDGQKEIFIWSLRAEVQERMCVLAGLLPPTPGPSHAGGNIISLSVVTLFFATVVCELGIKGPSMAVRYDGREGSSAPQRLLQLERETSARTGSTVDCRGRKERTVANV